MATGSFPGVKSGRGVKLTPHPLLVLWSRKSRGIPLLLLWAVRHLQSLSACTRVHFTFTLPLCSRLQCATQMNHVTIKILCTITNNYESRGICCLMVICISVRAMYGGGGIVVWEFCDRETLCSANSFSSTMGWSQTPKNLKTSRDLHSTLHRTRLLRPSD